MGGKRKIGDKHIQNFHSPDRKGFRLYFCDTRLHVKHCIAFAVWRVGFDLSAILHGSNIGTEACFYLNNFN